MKRYSLLLLSCIFLFSGCGVLGKYRIIRGAKEVIIKEPLKKLNVGERLTYKAEWLGLDVGIATLTIKGITEINGRQAYQIVATANTTALISKLYKVQDVMTTYFDVEEHYPLRFEKKQRQGGYRSDTYIDFDQSKGKAYYFSNLTKTKKEFDIPKKVQDPLSCLYFFRLQDVDVKRSIFADVNIDEKDYLVEAKTDWKGIIKLEGGAEWEALRVEPLPWFQGKLKRKAKATILFSADEKRIPLLVYTSGIPFVGSVTVTLQKIENLDTQVQ